MPCYISTLAFVINKKSVGDNDLYITLLTPNQGKISAIAKGIKNIKSRRLGNLQLGNVVKASIYSKNNSYWISETENIFPSLSHISSLNQTKLLFFYIELLNLLIADNQVIPGVFEISLNILKAISSSSVKEYIKNEIDFLNTLGFGLSSKITESYQQKNYRLTQKYIRAQIESIIEKKPESLELFR